jgi:hypothetical protein
MSAPQDVFRLVSLRGPDTTRTLDPSTFLRPSAGLAALYRAGRLWHQPEQLRTAIGEVQFLDHRDLSDQVPWSTVADDNTKQDERGKKIAVRVGRKRVDLDSYVLTSAFDAAFDALVKSWLVLRLRRRAALAGRGATALLTRHETALKFACAVRDPDVRTRGELGQRWQHTQLVLPRVWLEPEQSADAQESARRSRPATDYGASTEINSATNNTSVGMSLQSIHPLEKLKLQRTAAVADFRALQEILVTATLLADASDGDDRIPFDIKFQATVMANLARRARGMFKEFIRQHGVLNYVHDALTSLDVDARSKLINSNDLCKKIRVFEEEQYEQLPSARKQTDTTGRPSIRALGWGDLFVVREELIGYAASEISHIENILAGEAAVREFERKHKTIELVETEKTIETTTERDLETTDRFEIQAETSKSISTDFAVKAGVNTSGKYGLTSVDTSVTADLNRSSEESTRSAMTTARDIVEKSVQRTQQRTRELRRRTTIDSIRELANRTINNTASNVQNPKPESGLYLWVEKVQRMQLYQYGKRLMVEFTVPEPGLSLIKAAQPIRPAAPKPLPLTIGPNDIDETNYLCFAEKYRVRGVTPPPALFVQIGEGFATEINEQLENGAEATFQKALTVPPGYAVISGRFATTGAGRGARAGEDDNDLDDSDPIDTYPDRYHAHLSVGGEVVLDSVTGVGVGPPGQDDNPTRPHLRTNYRHSFVLKCPTMTDDHGIPLAVRFADHFDNTATMNVYLRCQRTTTLMDAWRLETYQRIVEAHDKMEAKYRDAVAEARFSDDGVIQTFGARPAETNRAVEREELKKWSVKLMRTAPYTFDAVVGFDGIEEIDPVEADEEAPIVRFFEHCFEWEQMSYMLSPYFWSRRSTWDVRRRISVPNDPQHEAFLRAGSARVIVPVAPGYDGAVLYYLGTPSDLQEWNQSTIHEWDPIQNPNQRIPPSRLDLESMQPADVDEMAFPDLWLELIEEYRPDVLRGSGKLKLTNGSAQAELVETTERVAQRDIGREIYIEGERYEIVAVIAPEGELSGTEFTLDRPYPGSVTGSVSYAIGSAKRGAPWNIRIPTTLVILADNRAILSSLV